MEVSEFYAKDRATWRQWLQQNHDKEVAVWLIFDKGKQRTMQWEDIVQEALCFGWVDSKGGTVSDTQSKIYVSRRKPKSAWSKINKEHVRVLTEKGLMTPAGQLLIDTAKQNGAWDELNKVDALEIPPELNELFTANSKAKEYFEAFSNSSKKIILQWIYSAKRPETREKRIKETVQLAAQNIKANHYRQ